MCIGDRKYCKNRVQHILCAAAVAFENKQPRFRDMFLNKAAAWMVMWAGAK